MHFGAWCHFHRVRSGELSFNSRSWIQIQCLSFHTIPQNPVLSFLEFFDKELSNTSARGATWDVFGILDVVVDPLFALKHLIVSFTLRQFVNGAFAMFLPGVRPIDATSRLPVGSGATSPEILMKISHYVVCAYVCLCVAKALIFFQQHFKRIVKHLVIVSEHWLHRFQNFQRNYCRESNCRQPCISGICLVWNPWPEKSTIQPERIDSYTRHVRVLQIVGFRFGVNDQHLRICLEHPQLITLNP